MLEKVRAKLFLKDGVGSKKGASCQKEEFGKRLYD